MPKKKDETVLVLRTCSADRTSHDGFTWPEVGGTATAPDWDPDPKRACGGGLHGLLWGCGDGGLLHGHDPTRLWQVVAVKISDIADMDAPDKVRFRTGTVVFEGDRDGATAYLGANGATGKPIAYGSATAGDSGSATAGDSGTIVVHWYDAKTNRYRLAVGYPGESGIEANVAYRCDDTGRLVRAEVAQ